MKHLGSLRFVILLIGFYFSRTSFFPLGRNGIRIEQCINGVLNKKNVSPSRQRLNDLRDERIAESKEGYNRWKRQRLEPPAIVTNQKSFGDYSAYEFSCHFGVDENSHFNDCISIFEKYDMYKYDNFKAYIHTLPGYREFIHKFHRKLDSDDKYRKSMKRKYKHWFINHIKDEDYRTQREWKEQQERERIENEEQQCIRQEEASRIEKVYKTIDANYSPSEEDAITRAGVVGEIYEKLITIEQSLAGEEMLSRTESYIDLGHSLLESDDAQAKCDVAYLIETLQFSDELSPVSFSADSVRLFGNSVSSKELDNSDFIDRKVIETINTTAQVCSELDLDREHHRTFYTNLSKTVITHKTSLVNQAKALNDQDNIEGAYWTLRVAKTLSQCARVVVVFADNAFQTFANQAADTIEPCINGVISLYNGLCYTASHPAEVSDTFISFMSQELDTDESIRRSQELGIQARSACIKKVTSLKDTVNYLGSAGAEFSMNYGYAFMTQEDLEGLDKQTQQQMRNLSLQHARALSSKVAEVARTITPEQCGKVVGTFGAEWAKLHCFNKGIECFTSSLLNLRRANLASEVVSEVEKIKAASATKAVESIEAIVQQSEKIKYISQVIEASGESAKIAVEKALKYLQTSLASITSEAHLLLVEALAKFPIKMPNVNWKHIFTPIIKKGKLKSRLQGFHSINSLPNNIVKITKQCDKHGIYEALYKYKELEKKSTFFPDHWNNKKIIKKIEEAYKNRISYKKNGFIGKTSEGIPIQFWFTKKKATGEIILNSIYPDY